MNSGTSTRRRPSIGKSRTPSKRKVTPKKGLQHVKPGMLGAEVPREPTNKADTTNGISNPGRETTPHYGILKNNGKNLKKPLNLKEILVKKVMFAPEWTNSDTDFEKKPMKEFSSTVWKQQPTKFQPFVSSPLHKPWKSTSNNQKDNFYREALALSPRYFEHSAELFQRASYLRKFQASKASWPRSVVNKSMQKLEPETIEELQEQKDGIAAFYGTPTATAIKSKAPVHSKLYSTKSPGTSRVTVGTSQHGIKKNVKIVKPEESMGAFGKVTNVRPIGQGQRLPQKFPEYESKKQELMEAALDTYDPDVPTFEALTDINDTSYEEDAEHLEATNEALNLLYGALTTNPNQPADKVLKTSLHVSKFPAPTDTEILQKSVFRPLDHFKGSVMGSVIREMKEEQNAKPPRQFSGALTRKSSTFGSVHKESKDKLNALRIIENFKLSKNRERKRFPGITLRPNTFVQSHNNDLSSPSYLIINKIPTITVPTNTRERKAPTKTTKSNGYGRAGGNAKPTVAFGSSFVTKNVDSLNSLKPIRGSEMSIMNMKTSTPAKAVKLNQHENYSMLKVYQKLNYQKPKPKTVPVAKKLGQSRKTFGTSKPKQQWY